MAWLILTMLVAGLTATNWFGHEGAILRFVLLRSIALAFLAGLLAMLHACVRPFSAMALQ